MESLHIFMNMRNYVFFSLLIDKMFIVQIDVKSLSSKDSWNANRYSIVRYTFVTEIKVFVNKITS